MRNRLLLLLLLPLLAAACIQRFDLGVGAFEIGPRSAILWARVIATATFGGLVPLELSVSSDPGFGSDVRHLQVTATADTDLTVRAKVEGLRPGTRYWYRFRGAASVHESVFSRTGSFRTAPARNEAADVHFVVSGDSNVGHKRSTGRDFFVLSAAAAEEPDFFLYFGDTVYADSNAIADGGPARDLAEYREIHRLTRDDPHLEKLLATTGTYVGWDDHEVLNDYAGESVDPARFAAGAQAFFEYLPLRVDPRPEAGPYDTFRTVRWGRHLELFLIDGRQFRSAEQFCNETLPDGPETAETLASPTTLDEELVEEISAPLVPLAAPLLLPSDPDCVRDLLAAPGRTYLGAAQLADLKAKLLASDATFKVIVNNTPISTLMLLPYDRWEGYEAERQDLLGFLASGLDPSRTLVLTTDFHTNFAIRRPELTELIVGPIATGTLGTALVSQLPGDLGMFSSILFDVFGEVIQRANGPESLLGADFDAFSYASIEVFEDAEGQPRLRATVRGDRDYADAANDPSRVVDLFSFEMPN